MSKSPRSSKSATEPLSVTLAEAIGAEKLAEVQAAMWPAPTESLLKELVLGGVAMVRVAGRQTLRRVRSVFSRAQRS